MAVQLVVIPITIALRGAARALAGGARFAGSAALRVGSAARGVFRQAGPPIARGTLDAARVTGSTLGRAVFTTRNLKYVPGVTLTANIADAIYEPHEIERVKANVAESLRRDGVNVLEPQLNAALTKFALMVREGNHFSGTSSHALRRFLEDELQDAGDYAKNNLRRVVGAQPYFGG